MAVSSVLHGMVVIVTVHAVEYINAVSRDAMVHTKQLTIAKTRAHDRQTVWAFPAVPHGAKRRNPF